MRSGIDGVSQEALALLAFFLGFEPQEGPVEFCKGQEDMAPTVPIALSPSGLTGAGEGREYIYARQET